MIKIHYFGGSLANKRVTTGEVVFFFAKFYEGSNVLDNLEEKGNRGEGG